MDQVTWIVRSDSIGGAQDDEEIRGGGANIEAELRVFRGRYVIGYTILRMRPEGPPRAGPPLLAHAVGGILTGLVLAVLLTLALHWRTGGGEPARLLISTKWCQRPTAATMN